MPYDELLCWLSYLERRPIEWRDDDRTYKQLQAWGFKGKPSSVFGSLKAIYEKRSKQDPLNLRGSAFFQQLLSAKGGDRLAFLEKEASND
jgi:flavodoxin